MLLRDNSINHTVCDDQYVKNKKNDEIKIIKHISYILYSSPKKIVEIKKMYRTFHTVPNYFKSKEVTSIQGKNFK